MSLYSHPDYAEAESFEELIDEAKGLYDRQYQAYLDAKALMKLTENNWVNSIRRNLSRYDYCKGQINEAFRQQNEKYKKDRVAFHNMEEIIREDFLSDNKDFKLQSIASCGYEDYGYRFDFKYKDEVFGIYIPMRDKVTVKNVGYCHAGQFAFYYQKGEHYWSVEKTSYNITPISEYIAERFKLSTTEVIE